MVTEIQVIHAILSFSTSDRTVRTHGEVNHSDCEKFISALEIAACECIQKMECSYGTASFGSSAKSMERRRKMMPRASAATAHSRIRKRISSVKNCQFPFVALYIKERISAMTAHTATATDERDMRIKLCMY